MGLRKFRHFARRGPASSVAVLGGSGFAAGTAIRRTQARWPSIFLLDCYEIRSAAVRMVWLKQLRFHSRRRRLTNESQAYPPNRSKFMGFLKRPMGPLEFHGAMSHDTVTLGTRFRVEPLRSRII